MERGLGVVFFHAKISMKDISVWVWDGAREKGESPSAMGLSHVSSIGSQSNHNLVAPKNEQL